MPAAGRQLEMRPRARDREEDPVVAVVVLEAAGLPQPQAVAVEGDHLGEAVRVAGDADLHQPATRSRPSPRARRRRASRRTSTGGPTDRRRVLALAVTVGERVDDPGARGLRALAVPAGVIDAHHDEMGRRRPPGGVRAPPTSATITPPSPNRQLRTMVLADPHPLREAERLPQPRDRGADVRIHEHGDDGAREGSSGWIACGERRPARTRGKSGNLLSSSPPIWCIAFGCSLHPQGARMSQPRPETVAVATR